MQIHQLLTNILALSISALCLPPFILHQGFPSPSLYPSEYAPPKKPALHGRRQASQPCASTCGDVCYFQRTVAAAVAEGFELFQAGETEGSGRYPHTFRNDEGFALAVAGPYLEFPLMDDFKEYDGGSPGPDRVVFNEVGALAGVLTHTGATRNGFVECG